MIVLILIVILLIICAIMRKTKLLIGILVTMLIIFAIVLLLVNHTISKIFNKGKSLEEITGVTFNSISYVKARDYIFDKEEFIQMYKNIKFKEKEDFEGKILKKIFRRYDIAESIAYVKYSCYDENNNLLYSIDTNNIIQINGKNIKYYQ